jgi:hypothetical protein
MGKLLQIGKLFFTETRSFGGHFSEKRGRFKVASRLCRTPPIATIKWKLYIFVEMAIIVGRIRIRKDQRPAEEVGDPRQHSILRFIVHIVSDGNISI